ncbi:MFS family permease [Pseudomonas syringae pv. actinidiae]|uniref:MFS family permease n=1 Tax=Pseudomonas syringae pv. actinidiae TaxID=103796 RepID=A0AAN4TNF9_PSESF|nr:MFS family permease [Pseudomonas syringae pv. actinidiae]
MRTVFCEYHFVYVVPWRILFKPFQPFEDETSFKRVGMDVSKAHETKGVSTKMFKC